MKGILNFKSYLKKIKDINIIKSSNIIATRLDRLKFRKKLIAAFLIVISLFVLGAGVNLFLLRGINNNFTDLASAGDTMYYVLRLSNLTRDKYITMIAELSPQYIKLDMSLIRGINFNTIKAALLEFFVSLAHEIGAKVVAEGIEDYDELEKVIELGVDYGQGYLIQRPQLEPQPVSEELIDFIIRKNN
ncbi:EAL domain-containing protein [Fuchsiella alkaliacetigena]|uniref:EAL domain-containing protein n=1 Tax=Fuchsiella alkaliacetigena TaxID=957042 RepID=UPI00200A2125|nr:EAL domain-containing protein [Fuchsiella alkaliacetigena]MCK8826105.1 EAL domain-containing protein [Fuchsiella alkaliacetigena]